MTMKNLVRSPRPADTSRTGSRVAHSRPIAAAAAAILVALATACTATDPAPSTPPTTIETTTAVPSAAAEPTRLAELETRLRESLGEGSYLALSEQDDGIVVNIFGGAEHDAATLMAALGEVRDGIASLPGETPHLSRITLLSPRDDGLEAEVDVPGSLDEATITTVLDAAIENPCSSYTVVVDEHDARPSSTIRCDLDAASATSLVAELPAAIQQSTLDTAITGDVDWEVHARAEGTTYDAYVRSTEVDAERLDAMADAAALLHETEAADVGFWLSDDRLDISATVDASEAGVGEQLMVILRPLGLSTITVTLDDAAAEGSSDPLAFLQE